uniref:Uncharacterized protein n=1 Tax=Oryza punctata TaxID=4537 RepID=A0A0E0KXA4_ORYPU
MSLYFPVKSTRDNESGAPLHLPDSPISDLTDGSTGQATEGKWRREERKDGRRTCTSLSSSAHHHGGRIRWPDPLVAVAGDSGRPGLPLLLPHSSSPFSSLPTAVESSNGGEGRGGARRQWRWPSPRADPGTTTLSRDDDDLCDLDDDDDDGPGSGDDWLL